MRRKTELKSCPSGVALGCDEPSPRCPYRRNPLSWLIPVLCLAILVGCAGHGTVGTPTSSTEGAQANAISDESSMLPAILSAQQFDERVLKAQKPTVAFFYLPECGVCRMTMPVMERLSKDYSGKVEFVRINANEVVDVSMKYQVIWTPTTILYEDGREVERFVGGVSETDMRTALDGSL